MSVEKYNPKIEYEDTPYMLINVHVVQNISNMEAGFVWIYLQSKPKDWIIIKEHIKNHFSIGNAKIKSIFSYLAKCNLIEYIQESGEKGQFGKHDIRILNGSRFKSYPQESTGGSIYRPAVNRSTGSGLLHIKENTKENKKHREPTKIKPDAVEKKPARIKRAPLSDGFCFNEANLKLCQDRKLNTSQVLEKFKAYYKAKKALSAEWQAQASLWILRERPDIPENDQKSNKVINEPRSTVKEFGPGHPSWEAMQEWNRKHLDKGLSNDARNRTRPTNM